MTRCHLLDDLLDQLAVTPNKFVLSWAGGEMSAAALAASIKARVAFYHQAGIQKGDRIAIWLPKGPCAIQCLLAAFHCGAIAVPIDPASPTERAKAILTEIQPKLMVTDALRQEKTKMAFGSANLPWPCTIEDPYTQDSKSLGSTGESALPIDLELDDPCLMLMTSGTTGTPKGVVATFGNIQCFLDWAIGTFALSSGDQFVNIAPLHFDLFLLDIVAALRVGASVRLLDERESLFPMDLAKVIESSGTSILYTVPTTLQRLLSHGQLAKRHLPNLRWVLFAGEVYPPHALEELMIAVPHPAYANLYGPSETNVVACKQIDVPPSHDDEHPNIGQACNHSNVTIRDDSGKQVPDGELGEICVAGPTVMQGYWGRPDLTQNRYLQNQPDTFKTGDFGYSDAKGDLRFVGRRDRQVKLAGYRTELGEVEAIALQSGQIEAAAVTVLEESQLLLHVVLKSKTTLDRPALRKWLREHLPRHSVPSSIIEHRQLPVTATGKIDYHRLTICASSFSTGNHSSCMI